MGRIEGYVEAVERGQVRGWAADFDAPERPIALELLLDGRRLSTALADGERSDLAVLALGRTGCGFALPVPEGTAIDLTRLRVRCVDSGAELPMGEQAGQYEGMIEKVERGLVSGWAWRAGMPRERVRVVVRHRGEMLARGHADAYREDLADAGVGDGRHGFVVRLRSPRSGGFSADAVTVEFEATGAALPFAPHFLEPEAEPELAIPDGMEIEGAVDMVSRSHASGWAWLPALPQAALRIEAVIEGEVIGAATANELRVDLAKHGKGTGAYGFRINFATALLGEAVPSFRALLPFETAVATGVGRLPALTEAERAQPPRGTAEQLVREHDFFTSRGPDHEEADVRILDAMPEGVAKPFVFAFYLPQFHPTPENDLFWGTGFTEWRQLARAMPRFPGHYQPRIPSDLGFYSLAGGVEALERQAGLAKAAGIDAFAYYYYWFNGKRVLHVPLEEHLANEVAMPFLLIWANENWTRTWDGSEASILLKQDYLE